MKISSNYFRLSYLFSWISPAIRKRVWLSTISRFNWKYGARRTLKRDQIIYIYRCEEIKLGRKKAETKHRSRDWLVSTNEPLRFNDPCASARRDRESNDSRKVITSGLKPMGKTMEIERLEKFFPRFKIPSLLLFPFPLRIHLVVSISFNVEKL